MPQDDPAKFKRVALSVAVQQNLASCVAVLKEVAAHYGFTLNIEDGKLFFLQIMFLQEEQAPANHLVVEGRLSGRKCRNTCKAAG